MHSRRIIFMLPLFFIVTASTLLSQVFDSHKDYKAVQLELGRFSDPTASGSDASSGYAVGGIHFSMVADAFVLEVSSMKFIVGKNSYDENKWLMLDAGTIDIGIAYTERFNDVAVSVGVVPYSWAWVKDGSDGLGLMSKVSYKNFLAEMKIVAVPYAKGYGFSVLQNNSFFGAHYILDDSYAIGVRFQHYGELSAVNGVVSILFE